MEAYAANTVRAASEASAVGCNYESGGGSGGGAAQNPQQHPSDFVPGLGTGSSGSSRDVVKLRRRGLGSTATLALIIAGIALIVAVAK